MQACVEWEPHLVSSEDKKPDTQPHVALHHEVLVAKDVPDRPDEQANESRDRTQIGELAPEEEVVSDGDKKRRARTEDDEGVDIAELQDLHVGEDEPDEAERHYHEHLRLTPLQCVDLNESEGACTAHSNRGCHELREQDEGGGRQVVDSELVDKEHGCRAQHIARHGTNHLKLWCVFGGHD